MSSHGLKYCHRTEEEDLQLAMQLSKSFMEQETSIQSESQAQESNVMDQSSVVSEEDEIQRAIAMSLEGKLFKYFRNQKFILHITHE